MTYDRKLIDAYRAGERAHDEGQPATENPYQFGGENWRERFMWNSGWAHRARMVRLLVEQRSAILQEQGALGL
jgi:hypothetical protein